MKPIYVSERLLNQIVNISSSQKKDQRAGWIEMIAIAESFWSEPIFSIHKLILREGQWIVQLICFQKQKPMNLIVKDMATYPNKEIAVRSIQFVEQFRNNHSGQSPNSFIDNFELYSN